MRNALWPLAVIVCGRCLAAADPAPSTQSPAAASQPEPSRLAIGLNDLGGQVRLHLAPNSAVEARFTTGKASSEAGNIFALAAGLRGYRFLREHRRCKLYFGLEGDYAQTSIHGQVSSNLPTSPTGYTPTQQSGFGNTSGYAAGGFAGLELRPTRRVAVDLDMGPYLLNLKEKTTGVTSSD